MPGEGARAGSRRRLGTLLGVVLGSLAATAGAASGTWEQRVQGHMGTRFVVQARLSRVGQSTALDQAMKKVVALEKRWSPWVKGSDVQRLNAAGGRAVRVSRDTFALIRRSKALCRRSGGAFDPTFFALHDLWNLRARPFVPPSDAAIAAWLPAVGCDGIVLRRRGRRVRLARPGARLHLGGNAKGTTLDVVASLLRRAGLRDFFVDGGGDVVVSGRGPHGPWRVGIQAPRGKRGAIKARLAISAGGSVASSGDYERYVDVGGKRYHHILDPRTGRPARGVQQVTVVTPAGRHAGELADALATALFVLGPRRGTALLRRYRGVDALWIDSSGKMIASPGMADRVQLPSQPAHREGS